MSGRVRPIGIGGRGGTGKHRSGGDGLAVTAVESILSLVYFWPSFSRLRRPQMNTHRPNESRRAGRPCGSDAGTRRSVAVFQALQMARNRKSLAASIKSGRHHSHTTRARRCRRSQTHKASSCRRCCRILAAPEVAGRLFSPTSNYGMHQGVATAELTILDILPE